MCQDGRMSSGAGLHLLRFAARYLSLRIIHLMSVEAVLDPVQRIAATAAFTQCWTAFGGHIDCSENS
jgi:hypothetical protein